MTKQRRKYAKPCAEVVKWDFNEAICVMTNSYEKYITVQSEQGVTGVETRKNTTGTWTRTGSR